MLSNNPLNEPLPLRMAKPLQQAFGNCPRITLPIPICQGFGNCRAMWVDVDWMWEVMDPRDELFMYSTDEVCY